MDFERLYYYAVFVAVSIPMAEIEKHLPTPTSQERVTQIGMGTRAE